MGTSRWSSAVATARLRTWKPWPPGSIQPFGKHPLALPQRQRIRQNLLLLGAEVRRDRHAHQAEGQEDDREGGQKLAHSGRVQSQPLPLHKAIEPETRAQREEEIQRRAERVSVEGEADLAMQQSRPTRGQAAARTGPIEQKHARARRQTEFLVGPM